MYVIIPRANATIVKAKRPPLFTNRLRRVIPFMQMFQRSVVNVSYSFKKIIICFWSTAEVVGGGLIC